MATVSVNGRAGHTHRPYQNAILEVLADGQSHTKDEIKMAGLRACTAFDSIAAWQRAHPEEEEKLRSLTDPVAASREALRQEVEGAKMMVGKSLSHLVDRGLMEVAAHDDKGKRSHYRITNKGSEFLANPPAQAPMQTQRRKIDMKECEFCGEEVDINEHTTYRFGAVWYRHSKGSGINQGRPIGPPSKYAHEKCLRDNFSSLLDQPVKIEEVLEKACDLFGLTMDEMLSGAGRTSGRAPDRISLPQQVTMVVCRNLGIPVREIDPGFGGRRQGASAKAQRNVNRWVKEDKKIPTVDGLKRVSTIIEDLVTEFAG